MTERVNFDIGIDDVDDFLAASRTYLVGDILRKNARVRSDRTAIVGEDGAQTTYGELDDRVNRLANALVERGIDYGSTVAVISENRPEFAEVIYGCAKIGAVCATENWRLAERELRHCLDVVETDAVVISEQQASNHAWLADDDSLSAEVVTFDDQSWGTSYEDLLTEGSTGEPVPSSTPTPEDALLVLYTSGTTGLPKGAVLSHRALVNRALMWDKAASMGPSYTAWKPMFHVMGTEPLFVVGINGGVFYTVDSYKPEVVLDRYTEPGQGYLPLAHGTVDTLLEAYEAGGYEPSDFEDTERIGSMADLYTPETIKEVTEAFDADFLNTYGATETSCPPLTGNAIERGTLPTDEDRLKTEGPMVDVKLVDEDWNEVPRGEYGELAARGPTLFSGYWGNGEVNEEVFDDGWYRTGDMFEMTEDGMYRYIDRKKYLIKCGGENIYPAAIERAFLEHEQVVDACVVRTPDDDWGEVPKAYVDVTDGADLSKDDLLAFLREQIASYKLPHYIEFVDRAEFPRSTTGNVVRSEVEDWPVSERVRNPLE